jgi:hypothetical protein
MSARAIILGLWLLGLLAALSYAVAADDPRAARLGLFLATLGATAVVLLAILAVRARLDAGDEARRPWTWIAVGLTARLIAELRLATLYFHSIPDFISADPALHFIYLQALRYLYVLADLLIAGALLITLRALASLGLGLYLRRRAWLIIAALALLPIVQIVVQDQLWSGDHPADPGILAFRVISVGSSALVGGLSFALAALTRQMGGGALAWVWGLAAVAGISKALAFLASAFAKGSLYAGLLDQSFLWTFAAAWLLAAAIYAGLIRPAAPR